jgi:hypothetical protein
VSARRARALVHLACLAHGGVPALAPLYRAADHLADLLARALGLRYGRALRLRGPAATRTALAGAVAAAARDPGVHAVDLVLHAHGQPGHLRLADGDVSLPALAADLRAAGAGKLRLAYSTACHAAEHGSALLGAGFRAAVGARGVNASGAVEVPLFFLAWALDRPLRAVLRLADAPWPRALQDAIARRVLGGALGTVDSAKVLAGEGTLRLGSAVAPGAVATGRAAPAGAAADRPAAG